MTAFPTTLVSPSSSWVRTTEPLLWYAGGQREIRTDTSYFFDANLRADRPHVTLQLTLAGAGFYEDRRGTTLLTPGVAFLDVIPGRFRYGYPPGATEPYELVFVSMQGPVAMRWYRRISRAFGRVLDLGRDNAIAPLMMAVARQWEEGAVPDRYQMSGQLYGLLMSVLSTLNRSRVETTPQTGRAIALIAERGHESSFNVSTLAEMLDCSREHLARQFRAATGVSPSDYLIQHRLRLAARAMRSSTDKLELVARRSGFSGANYLCRAFRQRFGVTPAQFRARPWTVAT